MTSLLFFTCPRTDTAFYFFRFLPMSKDQSKVRFTQEQLDAYIEYFTVLARIRERCIREGIDYKEATRRVRERRQRRLDRS
ncbi:hypothetical protein COU77_00950 [Candidatus Peregrinibacteria bacterium CG10_big_fil_rev_8_21_14_0_10_49_16]|nr:MAG: hypothetical protein COW95_03295 [Candidatus Peregrinibacteria bacterium CG22_combo_CG10-13_8_21_14_all_49_11]PIR52324.1 MAG: hypothetical protein COU77_00950 [Candidatus Peregrinibacteria bacterium CG10_big_fil_rev_8_21_14_0_10_49_16]